MGELNKLEPLTESQRPYLPVKNKIYSGRMGRYKVLSTTKPPPSPKGQLIPPSMVKVEYISGSWKGYIKDITLNTHLRMQENLDMEYSIRNDEVIKDKLDKWYERFPDLYKKVFYQNPNEAPWDKDLLAELELKHPKEAELIDEIV